MMIAKKPRTVHCYPESITFGFYTPDDIRKISVVEVVRPESFTALGNPSVFGLYDPHMGTTEKNTTCETCHMGPNFCPGHYGHIELPVPCFHPLFLRNVVNIMKMTCPACKRFLISGMDSLFCCLVSKLFMFLSLTAKKKMILIARLELLKYGLITEAQQFHQIVEVHGVDENDESASETEVDAKEEDGIVLEEAEEDEKKGSGEKKKGKETKATLEKMMKDINEAMKKIKKEHGIKPNDIPPPITRNVEHLRQSYINSFLKKLSVKKVCSLCKGGWKKVVLYQSRIVFSLYRGTSSVAIG